MKDVRRNWEKREEGEKGGEGRKEGVEERRGRGEGRKGGVKERRGEKREEGRGREGTGGGRVMTDSSPDRQSSSRGCLAGPLNLNVGVGGLSDEEEVAAVLTHHCREH